MATGLEGRKLPGEVTGYYCDRCDLHRSECECKYPVLVYLPSLEKIYQEDCVQKRRERGLTEDATVPPEGMSRVTARPPNIRVIDVSRMFKTR